MRTPNAEHRTSNAEPKSRGKKLEDRIVDNGHRKVKRSYGEMGALGSPGRFFVGNHRARHGFAPSF